MRGIPEAKGLVMCSLSQCEKLPSHQRFFNVLTGMECADWVVICVLVDFGGILGPHIFVACRKSQRSPEPSLSLAAELCMSKRLKESAVTGMRCVGVAVLVTVIVCGRSYVFRVSHLGEKSPRHTLQQQNPPSS